METFEEAVCVEANKIAQLLIKKNKDYGSSNLKEFGEMGILVRTNDKFSRLKNLILNNKSANMESIEDTWSDIAGYSILALMLRNGSLDLPFKKE